MIVIAGGNAFSLAHEHKNGWNVDAFRERYSEVLDRYDFIVGDWGYNQLRLRGFFREGHPRATKETTIAGLADYINEYCNFGCAYFVLARADVSSLPPGAVAEAEGAEAEKASATATSEAAAQAAETAAASGGNGVIMRWPLKERAGGPVRVPSSSAVARAVAEAAERRNQQAAGNAKPGDARPSRQGADGAFGGRAHNRPPAGAGADKRSAGGYAGAGGPAEGRSGGKPGPGQQRGPKPQSEGRFPGANGGAAKPNGHNRPTPQDAGRMPDARSEVGKERSDGAKSGGRWAGKNRRRGRFDGKPGRSDGAGREGGGPRSDPGKPGAD